MKKILFAAVMLISSATAFAQHSVGSFTLQPKIGLNIANVTKVDNSDPRCGLAIGAELEYQATDIVSFTAGALYSMQGSKEDYITLKLDYINLPILANVYVTKGLAVKLGLQPGIKTSSKFTAKEGSFSQTATFEDVKSMDLSIPIGLSYEHHNFVIDARYNFGLLKIHDDFDNSKNSVFQFTLGYKFDL